MSSLSQPEPAPRPPVLSDIYAPGGQLIATLARRPGATRAILRDAQGRMRQLIDSENPALEAMRYIENHMADFQPTDSEEQQCRVPQE